MRLTNFNVEAQCTPSRAALLTGRYAIRTGNATVPWNTPIYGLTQWEYTLAEMFRDAGYATAIYGKWHLGNSEGRYPTDQGFDEWYGIPNSSSSSYWPDSPYFKEDVHPQAVFSYILEASSGSPPRKIKVYDIEARREIDREITDRAKAYMHTQVQANRPFFLYLPYTQTHVPVLPSRDFEGKSGNGPWADVLTQIDAYTGELLDTVNRLGIRDNTIFVFTSDNGPGMSVGQEGSSGPWRGTYFTGLEGSLRVPFIIRWPNRVPANSMSDEVVHEMDILATFASFLGTKIPNDRKIDSIDQSDFFLGQSDNSSRESFVVYIGNDIFGVKWRNWKFNFSEIERGYDAVQHFKLPRIHNLYRDPKEEYPINSVTGEIRWLRWPMSQILIEHSKSMELEPPIKPGTEDPYLPPSK
jgi:arylsulfatase